MSVFFFMISSLSASFKEGLLLARPEYVSSSSLKSLESEKLTSIHRHTRMTLAVVAVAVFAAWTLTSFLCHECGKLFLQISEMTLDRPHSASDVTDHTFVKFYLALLLTSVQCLLCFVFVRPAAESCQHSRMTSLLLFTHVLATLATNYSMAYIEAASTLAIKLTEPITMAVAHHVTSRTSVPAQTVISVPLIVCGALVFTGAKIHEVSNSVGLFLAFASNIILAARNITLKKLQAGSSTHKTIELKPHLHIGVSILVQIVLLAGLYFLESQSIIPKNCSLIAGLSMSSGVFHVAYSYISTNLVLKVMNVVSHSIANIFKRFLVVLFLCLVGNRQISAMNYLGLVVAACGLLVYTHGKARSEVQPTKQTGDNTREYNSSEQRRFLALLFLFIVSFTTLGTTGLSRLQFISNSLKSDDGYKVYRENHCLYKPEAPSTNFSHILEAETDPEMRDFLSWRLVDHPEDTDRRAKTLTSNKDVVEEAQRILVNLLQDLLGKARHVMLIDVATYENKGDPAIAVGEIMLLRRMNISIVYYCETNACSKNTTLVQALKVNKRYPKDELVILMQGGGNLVGYHYFDVMRKIFIDNFPDRRIILLSQSIWFHSKNIKHLEYCRKVYSNHSNLIMFLRDRQSLEIAKKNFLGVKLILAPDMAFGIGMVPRLLPPLYDIVWLMRGDRESSGYHLPVFPANIFVEVTDWWSWTSNRAHTVMDNAFQVTSNGFQFLQRGRVVVTDRLHGHILSTLMNIPHVLIDNPPFLKLSSFDRSWTKSLSNTVLVSNGSLALDVAIELLSRYHNDLPSVGPIDKNVG